MKFSIELTDSAVEDIDYFRKSERLRIADGIELFLSIDADVETRRRKPMRPNPLGEWELRIDDFRVFYNVEAGGVVKVTAVGRKEHNDLYIRGEKVEI